MYKVIETYKTLYKVDTKGKTRVWNMLLGGAPDGTPDTAGHCAVTGLIYGKKVQSGWASTEPKNIGKANETNALGQAVAEITAMYEKKLREGYFESIDDIDKVTFITPMLAVDWQKRKDKVTVTDGVYAQPKLDGIRCIARKDGMYTRTGKPIPISAGHIHKAIKKVWDEDPDVIFDGELYNHDLKDDFNTITSLVRKEQPNEEELAKAQKLIQYHIYDLPSSKEVFSVRNKILEDMWVKYGFTSREQIVLVETVKVTSMEELDKLYARWIEEGYEGEMVRLDEGYFFKRSNALMKRKDFFTDEFPVDRVEEGNGNWAGYIKKFFITLPDGRVCGAGVRGNQKVLKALVDEDTPHWATLRYFTPTPDGMPRFPVVVDWGYGTRKD